MELKGIIKFYYTIDEYFAKDIFINYDEGANVQKVFLVDSEDEAITIGKIKSIENKHYYLLDNDSFEYNSKLCLSGKIKVKFDKVLKK